LKIESQSLAEAPRGIGPVKALKENGAKVAMVDIDAQAGEKAANVLDANTRAEVR